MGWLARSSSVIARPQISLKIGSLRNTSWSFWSALHPHGLSLERPATNAGPLVGGLDFESDAAPQGLPGEAIVLAVWVGEATT